MNKEDYIMFFGALGVGLLSLLWLKFTLFQSTLLMILALIFFLMGLIMNKIDALSGDKE